MDCLQIIQRSARAGLCLAVAFALGKSAQAASSISMGTAPGGEPTRGGKLLARSLNYCRELNSFTFDLELGTSFEREGFYTRVYSRYSAAFQRPSHLALVLQTKTAGATLVSDGSLLHTYLPALGKYDTTTAPTNLADFDATAFDKSVKGPSPVTYTKPLFDGADGNDFTQTGNKAAYVGEELVEGVNCDHIRYADDGGTYDLWLEKGPRPLFRKVSYDITYSVRKSSGTSESLKDMRTQVYAIYRNWQPNPQLGAERFQLTPPQGAVVSESPKAAPTAETTDDLVGRPAPGFKLALLNGGQLDLAAHKGKHIVILEFWALWSVPSKRALPELTRLAESYRDKDVVFYAIDEGEKPEPVKAFLAGLKSVPPVGIGPGSSLTDLYHSSDAPTFVLIDKDGVIRFHDTDYRYPVSLELQLQDLIAGKSPQIASGTR